MTYLYFLLLFHETMRYLQRVIDGTIYGCKWHIIFRGTKKA